MKDTIQSIARWFTTAKPNATEKDATTQLGVAFEEDAEFVNELVTGGFDDEGDAEVPAELPFAMLFQDTYRLAEDLKKGIIHPNYEAIDKVKELDALCDRIVTIVGYATYRGYDIVGALAHIDDSNWSKFDKGLPILDENGKIKKGPNYFKPVLDDFIPD